MKTAPFALIVLAAALAIGASGSHPGKGELVYLPFTGSFVVDLFALGHGRTVPPYELDKCDEFYRCPVTTSPCEKLVLVKQTRKKTITTRPGMTLGLEWRADLRHHTYTTRKACHAAQAALEAERDGITLEAATDAILIDRIEAFLAGAGSVHTDFRPESNELGITAEVWGRLPDYVRSRLAHGLAIMCESAGYDRWVRVRDIATGVFLARYGPAGFEERPTTPASPSPR